MILIISLVLCVGFSEIREVHYKSKSLMKYRNIEVHPLDCAMGMTSINRLFDFRDSKILFPLAVLCVGSFMKCRDFMKCKDSYYFIVCLGFHETHRFLSFHLVSFRSTL